MVNENEDANKDDYSSYEVAKVLNQVQFHFWGEVVDWMRKHAVAETDLTSEQANKMMQDFQRLSDLSIPFTSDPGEATEIAKANRKG